MFLQLVIVTKFKQMARSYSKKIVKKKEVKL